jgi:hypothetical protein
MSPVMELVKETKGKKVVVAKRNIIDSSKLTNECWSIQFWGISACAGCEFNNKRSCGGKAIREKLGPTTNSAGHELPL